MENKTGNKTWYVDLGLPSGTLWSACYEGDCDPDGPTPFLAGAVTESYLEKHGIELPSTDDVTELINCTWQTVDVCHGKPGIKFTSKNNGQSIFMQFVECEPQTAETYVLLSNDDALFSLCKETGECFIMETDIYAATMRKDTGERFIWKTDKYGAARRPAFIVGIRHTGVCYKVKECSMPNLVSTVFEKLSSPGKGGSESGTIKCWSPVCGVGTARFADGLIRVTPDRAYLADGADVDFDEFGRLYGCIYPGSECLLFPAKGETDWKHALSDTYVGEPVLARNSIGGWNFGYWQKGRRLALTKDEPEEDWWNEELDCYFKYVVPFWLFDPADPDRSAIEHSII